MKYDDSFRRLLEEHTIAAAPELVQQVDAETVRCQACAHRCVIGNGESGICRVRMNRGGALRVPGGYVAGLQIDPIEKKPFYHVFPGRTALSFGMLGCNFHCAFCQNWVSSQVLRDNEARTSIHPTEAQDIVDLAIEHHAPVIVSTYNEPLITSDWAARIFELAHPKGITCGFVSNGHASPEVIAFLRPFMRLFKVDLKCFDAARYRELGGKMEAVLQTIERLFSDGFWVEVVTLVVPGFNDTGTQLEDIARFIASVSPDIPWHVTAFRPEYHANDNRPTQVGDLERAYAAGKSAGLRYVYWGNLWGSAVDTENTICPTCHKRLITRHGFHVSENTLIGNQCPACKTVIPGIWGEIERIVK